MRILNDVIILTPRNPDGMELVSNWYMREQRPDEAIAAGLPQPLSKVRRAR